MTAAEFADRHAMIEPLWAGELLRLHGAEMTEAGLKAMTLLATGSVAAAENAALKAAEEKLRRSTE
jgi:hypothetical protein